jgi:hypothetical protein
MYELSFGNAYEKKFGSKLDLKLTSSTTTSQTPPLHKKRIVPDPQPQRYSSSPIRSKERQRVPMLPHLERHKSQQNHSPNQQYQQNQSYKQQHSPYYQESHQRNHSPYHNHQDSHQNYNNNGDRFRFNIQQQQPRSVSVGFRY